MSNRMLAAASCLVLAWLACVCLGSAGAGEGPKEPAIKKGDKVRVINGPAPVKGGEKTLATFETGKELEVLQVEGGWAQVKPQVKMENGGWVFGWVEARKHLEPVPGDPKGPTQAAPLEPGLRAIFADSVALRDNSVRAKAPSRLLWVEMTVQAPAALDMKAIRVEDADKRSHLLIGFGHGRRDDGKPFTNHLICKEPRLFLEWQGPVGVEIAANLLVEGPTGYKLRVEIGPQKATVNVLNGPAVINLLFAVPRDATGFTLKGVPGPDLRVPMR
ncbi:MAG: hypothetical protein FJ290_06390 [Planctomycetes bacterium]|nr:hypothetical protein [Planctomycetota bacterium]